MSEESTPNLTIAKRLTEALNRGDLEAIDSIYHADIRVWRNLDSKELNKDQVMKVVRFLFDKVDTLHYENVRAHATDRGFVQQHELCGTVQGSTELRAHACMVATLQNDQIIRIEEYLDSNALAPLMGK